MKAIELIAQLQAHVDKHGPGIDVHSYHSRDCPGQDMPISPDLYYEDGVVTLCPDWSAQ